MATRRKWWAAFGGRDSDSGMVIELLNG
jgi:hypothetical protein